MRRRRGSAHIWVDRAPDRPPLGLMAPAETHAAHTQTEEKSEGAEGARCGRRTGGGQRVCRGQRERQGQEERLRERERKMDERRKTDGVRGRDRGKEDGEGGWQTARKIQRKK